METMIVGKNIRVTLDNIPLSTGAELESNIERETCPHCGEPICCYNCDLSVANNDSEDEVVGRLMFNGALDGIESLILACASAGINVAAKEFVEAVETAIQATGNNF